MRSNRGVLQITVARRAAAALGLAAVACAVACDGAVDAALDAGTLRLPDGRIVPRDGGAPDSSVPPTPQVDGWIDLAAYLVPSDGSRSFGDPGRGSNDTRDQGTRIAYFDVDAGDQDSAEPYFWDGVRIVDVRGSPTNPENGEAYGDDPLEPNLAAIRPFRLLIGTGGNTDDADDRIRTHNGEYDTLAGGYPDWYLFRRGQTHTTFETGFVGGRSPAEPMVVTSYGPSAEARAVMDPEGENPFSVCPCGASGYSHHVVFASLDIRVGLAFTGLNDGNLPTRTGEPPSVVFEDCRFTEGPPGGRITYVPEHTTFHRSVIGFSWSDASHNQGYYTAGPANVVTFDEVIFYKNGYKSNPRTEVDPRRDIFSRNLYEGGGARMGHTHRNIISADGASGGPQMRFGGLIENSLVIEGYWFSATNSNSTTNPWPTIQEGQSAVVRNNVQFVLAYPTPADPDSAGGSDENATPGGGYSIGGSTFGAVVEGNIISGAMLFDELDEASSGEGIQITPTFDEYPDGNEHTQRNNTIRGNIVYRTGGLNLGGGQAWSDVSGIVVEDNVFAGPWFVRSSTPTGLSSEGLVVRANRFYGSATLPEAPWMGTGNTVGSLESAAASEGWTDPDRTLRRYVTEVLGLTLLDWADDPFLDAAQRDARAASGEEYDPTGLKTFMAVATNMRRGGPQPIPSSGKPSWTGDYPWDARFTAITIVNWIRAGFGMDPVE